MGVLAPIHRHVDLGSLVTASGSASSQTMDFRKWRRAASKILIYGPDTLSGTVKVQVSEDNSNWRDLQNPQGTDVTVVVGDVSVIPYTGWKYLKLLSSGNEGGNRTFIIKGMEGI